MIFFREETNSKGPDNILAPPPLFLSTVATKEVRLPPGKEKHGNLREAKKSARLGRRACSRERVRVSDRQSHTFKILSDI